MEAGSENVKGTNAVNDVKGLKVPDPSSTDSVSATANGHSKKTLTSSGKDDLNAAAQNQSGPLKPDIKDVDGSDQVAKPDGEEIDEKEKIHKLPADSDSDSDSVKSDGEEDFFARYFANRGSSKALYSAFRLKMERRAEEEKKKKKSPNQGVNLVKGLVDYMRVLENRIDGLEKGTVKSNKEKKDKGGDRSGSGDTTVDLGIKFFNSVGHIEADGKYLDIHDGTEEGSYMCDHDAKHRIRVLYTWTKDDAAQPRGDPESGPPDPEDIDIITFGVLSEPIAAFFAMEIDIGLDNIGHLIRFGKPFKPIIRHLRRLREQLQKLENRYGRVVGSGDESQPVVESQPESPEAKANRDEGSVLPFSAAENDQDDGIASYDRPTALPHFRALLKFADKYFGKQIELFDRLQEGKEERVAFENLWMLFDSKDTIYCRLREAGPEVYYNEEGEDHRAVRRHTPQAYRVVATGGGMPLMNTLAPTPRLKDQFSPAGPFMGTQANTGVNALVDIFAQIETTSISRKVRNSYTELRVYCFYIDFNGIGYGTVREVFIFKPYEREMDIRSLQAYPIQYVTNYRLPDRGKLFMEATQFSHKQYEGLTTGANREDINSSVVLDVQLAFEGDPGPGREAIEVPKFTSPITLWLGSDFCEAYDIFSKPSCSNQWCYNRDCTSNIYKESQKKVREKIESEIKLVLEEYESEKQKGKEGLKRFQQLMENKDMTRLLPGTVPGFALRNRKWVLLDLNVLKNVEQNSEWKDLVLPPGHQEMVQAMVETHTNGLGSSKDGTNKIGMDLVRGKGKGCIILLHGVPGVGKTSTAECVAAHTGKPLYPITCGDIGYKPEDVEKNMENHFKLAHRWGCVLLLDEADVFLAKRDQRDVQRNGLVSVFLRILEYYAGILFLTTNRVGTLDDAFRSRLHLTLYYPKLTKKQASKIFRRNFRRIAEINVDREKIGLPPFEYKDSEKKVIAWVVANWKILRWNGRQIRNAFQTVLALAEFHAKGDDSESKTPVVTRRHFKTMANASLQFNSYLKQTLGYDEDGLAKRDLVRALEFSPSGGQGRSPLDEEDSDDSSSEGESDEGTESDDDSETEDEKRKKKKKKKIKQTGKKEKAPKSTGSKSKKMAEMKVKVEKKKKDKKDKKEDSDDSD